MWQMSVHIANASQDGVNRGSPGAAAHLHEDLIADVSVDVQPQAVQDFWLEEMALHPTVNVRHLLTVSTKWWRIGTARPLGASCRAAIRTLRACREVAALPFRNKKGDTCPLRSGFQ